MAVVEEMKAKLKALAAERAATRAPPSAPLDCYTGSSSEALEGPPLWGG